MAIHTLLALAKQASSTQGIWYQIIDTTFDLIHPVIMFIRGRKK